jgi:hypothetical protein
MKYSFLTHFTSVEITLTVVICMIACYWLGHVIRRKIFKRESKNNENIGVVQGSLLGLLALILGFSFSLSNNRYDKRLNLVIEESNAIGTAILRADLYPDSLRRELRKELKAYLEARIMFNEAGPDTARIATAIDSTNAAQQRLWAIATAATLRSENLNRNILMIPALNEMFDLGSSRFGMMLAKIPDLIMFILFLLCLTGAYLLGYADRGNPEWGIVSTFLVMIGLAIYMILDLDRPRTGLINNKAVFQTTSALRSMFKEP